MSKTKSSQPPRFGNNKINLAKQADPSPVFAPLLQGLLLLVLEYLFLPVFGLIHKTVVDGQGFLDRCDTIRTGYSRSLSYSLILVSSSWTGSVFYAIGMI